jgi:hypothetical protein
MSHISLISRFLLLFVMFASSALAASVSVGGNSPAFSVDGTGMSGIYGVQVDINYDPASLGYPAVTKGALASRALFAENHSTRGLIRIAVISNNTFSESGQIAAITFASKTGSGGITSLRYNIIDSSGSSIASSKENSTNESESQVAVIPLSTSSQSTESTLINQAGRISTATYPGTITLTADPQQKADLRPEPTLPVSTNSDEPTVAKVAEQNQHSGNPVTEEQTAGTTIYYVYKGIFDRFRQYSGNKRLSDIAALFGRQVDHTIHQEPAILLSDGKNKAVLTIDVASGINSSTNFAVNGGILVSLKQDQQNKERWIVEVLPKADAVKVTVTVIAGTRELEYPLTVSPPLKTDLTLDEQGWSRFLKEVGTARAPLHDLNRDGVRDYMDEFIFVANYLAGKSAQLKNTLHQ